MSLEFISYYELIGALLPIFAITEVLANAIIARDNDQCQFPFPHICKGKLSIHQIDEISKDDVPENLIRVCRSAHWNHLHNGATYEEKELWQAGLSRIARARTELARLRGWVFPGDQ